MGIKHTFVSAVADGADATLVRPSNWNEDHTIDADIDFSGFDLLVDDNTGIGSTEAGNPELLYFESVASAVNYLKITNSATGAGPSYSAAGDDANVGLTFAVKGTGASSPTSALIPLVNAGTANQASFAVKNTSAGNTGPGIIMFADSASPASDDYPGAFEMWGRDSANNAQLYGAIWAHVVDATSTSEDGELLFYTTIAGSTYRVPFCVGNGAIVGTSSDIAYPGIGNLGISSGSFIKDEAANEFLGFTSAASAVNYLQIANAATANYPSISAAGSDTNVGMTFTVQGAPKPAATFNLGNHANFPEFTIVGTSSVGPFYTSYSNDASPTADDYVGGFNAYGNDSGGNKTSYMGFDALIDDPTNGSEDSHFELNLFAAGTRLPRMKVGDGVLIGNLFTYPGAGNLAFADAKGIFDGAGNEQLIFQETASAVNYLEVVNSATGVYPQFNPVGSDTNVGMIFNVQGAPTNAVTFNLGNPTQPRVRFTSTNAGSQAVSFVGHADSASPAANDFVTAFRCNGEDSAGNETEYGSMQCRIIDPTNTTEDSALHFFTLNAGGGDSLSRLRIAQGLSLGQNFPSDPGDGNISMTDGAYIADDNANEYLKFQSIASAVNFVEITNAATGGSPSFTAAGDDTDIGIDFNVKGADIIQFNVGSGAPAPLRIYSTNPGAGGPKWDTFHDSASPAANDVVCEVDYYGRDSAGNQQLYGFNWTIILDTTNLSEDSKTEYWTRVAGSDSKQFQIGDGIKIGNVFTSTFPGAGNISFPDLKGIFDDTGNEQLLFDEVASAVNYLQIANAATYGASGVFSGSSVLGPIIKATGSDANVSLKFQAKSDGNNYVPFVFEVDPATASQEYPQFNFISHDPGAGGPYLIAFHNSATPAANDEVGGFTWQGRDSGANETTYGNFKVILDDPTNASEDSHIVAQTMVAGGLSQVMGFGNGVIVGTGTTYPGAGGLIVEKKLATPLVGTLTIATGAITATGSYHRVDTEAAAATDDLDTINGGIDGMRLVIRAADSARTVVAKDGTGNLQLAGDCTLDNAQDTLELIFDNALSAWLEIGRSDNGA